MASDSTTEHPPLVHPHQQCCHRTAPFPSPWDTSATACAVLAGSRTRKRHAPNESQQRCSSQANQSAQLCRSRKVLMCPSSQTEQAGSASVHQPANPQFIKHCDKTNASWLLPTATVTVRSLLFSVTNR